MNILAATLAGLELGQPATFKELTVLPLLANRDGDPDYLTLDDALEAGLARVTEVSEAGSVPELSFVNDADKGVLLVDGEELVGASATFRKFMRKVLGSYALDAAEEAADAGSPASAAVIAKAFLDRLQRGTATPYKALAEGEDLRIDLGDVTAGALVVGDKVVHLAAFAVAADRDAR